MKFVLLSVCAVMLLSACVLPSHAIRINESLPKNAPIENETVVTYVQPGCSNPKGDCPLKYIIGHYETLVRDVRQVEFYRYSRMTCVYEDVSISARDYKYYVVWHKEGVPYRAIEAFCDEKSQDFKAYLVYDEDKQRKELPVLKNSGEWVIDIK